MAHEMSKKHADQVAEKAAIIANTAFMLGRRAERQHIIDLMMNEPVSAEVHKVINMLKESVEEND
jgi:hypothetical protein